MRVHVAPSNHCCWWVSCTEKNGTPASPAQALASIVLPVPGGPVKSMPLGMVAPKAWYLAGFFRKSTTSSTSLLL